MKIVIRAGGHGTRLWPLSRKRKPKQFHSILENRVLLRMTFDRVYPLVNSCDDIYISCNEEYVEALAEIIPEIPSKNYILEPEARNTGPAIALETAFLLQQGIAEDTVVASIPSDDYIGNEEAFRMLFEDCEEFLGSHNEYLVAPAAIPTVPSDGYSYLGPGTFIGTVQSHNFTLVNEWLEKPDQVRSRELLNSGKYAAHVGMYLWCLGTAAHTWEHYQKEIWEAVQHIVEAMQKKDGAVVHEQYTKLPRESVETMLIRHLPEIAMVVDSEMHWSDVGKWQIVKHLIEKDENGNAHRGRVVSASSTGNLVMVPEGKVVAVIGMQDVVVIDTEDALLVCPAERSGEVKDLLRQIQEIENGRHL